MTVDPRLQELEKENAALRSRLAELEPTSDQREGDVVRRLLGARVLLENIPDVVSITDRDHRIL